MGKNISQMIPQGDPESVRRQVTQTLNRIGTQLAKSDHRTAPMDMGFNRIANLADPGAPGDGVNLRTLKKHLDQFTIQHVQRKNTPGVLYSIVFSNIGTLVSGQLSAPYIIMPQRAGTPVIVKIAATTTGTADAHFQVQRNGTNIMVTDMILPAGSAGPLSFTNFVGGLGFQVNDLITPVCSTGGGVAYATVEIELQP